MLSLPDLWIPILASAAAVWIASAVIWMALPHHRKDHLQLPDEEGFAAAAGPLNIPPGNYSFPYVCRHSDAASPEFKARWERGPRGQLSVWPAKISMGLNMALTFAVFLVVSVLIAYLGSITLKQGDGFMRVWQVLGTAGVLAYSFAFIPNGIWFRDRPRAIVMCVIDGIAYGLITGAVFAALWPGAAA